jgi:hypothetical protein
MATGRIMTIGLLLALVGCSSQPETQREPFTPLFDGESLDGWRVSGDANWDVDGGEIVAAGAGDGFLMTERKYENFHLTLDFWVDASTNSGIFSRCTNRENIHPDTCYEANIWDEHPEQVARTGSIVFKAMPPLKQVSTVGKWNTYKIAMEGRFMMVEVNGEITAYLYDADIREGFIALQHWRTGTVKLSVIKDCNVSALLSHSRAAVEMKSLRYCKSDNTRDCS